MKQNYFLRMFTILLFLCITTHSYAEVYSGSCGENVKWSLDTETGLLEIAGSGEMNGYTHCNTPWYNYKSYIKECNIKNGITTIGAYAFYECYSLTNVTIPKSITTIGIQAFYNCTGLKNVYISDLAAWCNISFRGYTYGSSPANPLYYAQHLYLNGEEIKDLVIPNGVSTIKDYAFNGFKGLTSVTIPNSVTTIGNTAFYFCTGLTDITIPNSVTMIGNDAFHNTHWYNNQPDGIIYLGNHFYDYKGTMPQNTVINIKEGTTTIASCAFSSCTGLSSITIPNSITTIGNYTFSGCTGLKSITIPNDLTIIGNCAFYNCTGLTEITIPNNVTTIGDDAFNGCNNLKTVINLSNLNITIGNTSNGYVAYYANKVINADAQIEDFLFIETEEGNTLCNYIGNKSILSLPLDYKGGKYGIGDNVFKNRNGLTSITIPNSVKSIGNYAFYGCTGLTSIKIPENVISIGERAFANCIGLTSFTIPNGVTSIGMGAFASCTGLTSIKIPESLTSIGEWAFENCSRLNKIFISDLSAWCKISFSDNPLSYAKHLYLNGKEITDLVIPEDVTSIGGYAFAHCSTLTSVSIPESVISIGSTAFIDCTGLTSVNIANSVTSIGTFAFAGCTELKSVIIGNGVTSIGMGAFQNCPTLTNITIPESVTRIESNTFYDCARLTNVNLGHNVTSIGQNAFAGCIGLTNITIPKSITNIETGAFYRCTNLKIVLNNSNLDIVKGESSNGYVAYYANKVVFNADTLIGDFCFKVLAGGNYLARYIGNESKVTLPEAYKGNNYGIGNYAFFDCPNLNTVILSKAIDKVEPFAFTDNTGNTIISFINVTDDNEYFRSEDGILFSKDMTKLVRYPEGKEGSTYNIPETVTRIADNAFLKCTALSSITVPADATSIGNGAFNGCSSITSISLPDMVTSIGEETFAGCSRLRIVELGRSVTTIGTDAFKDCTKMRQIYCRSQEPPVCGNSALDGIDTWDCTLFVPEGAEALYKAADQWKEFFFIEEITGIDAPKVDKSGNATFDIYDMSGRMVRKGATTTDGLKPGLYIINGRKVLVE